MMDVLEPFVRESNKIEGIVRDPTAAEIGQLAIFLQLGRVGISDLVDFVAVYQPNARPRFVQGLDVRVGPHVPPRGGPHIQPRLQAILDNVNGQIEDAYTNHVHYEKLHPFTDGNGRSGRALWLWQMMNSGSRNEDMALGLGFLHAFYYQALQHGRE
jgi:hypothetical protein